jgi:hypothetical protein
MAKQPAQSIAIGVGPIGQCASRRQPVGDKVGQLQGRGDPDRHGRDEIAE